MHDFLVLRPRELHNACHLSLDAHQHIVGLVEVFLTCDSLIELQQHGGLSMVAHGLGVLIDSTVWLMLDERFFETDVNLCGRALSTELVELCLDVLQALVVTVFSL